MTPEPWWVFVEDAPFGYKATAESSSGETLSYRTEMGFRMPVEIWRPTEQWARRAMARRVRRALAAIRRRDRNAEPVRGYPV